MPCLMKTIRKTMSKKREYCKHIEPAKKPGKEYMITKDNDSVTR